MRYRGVTSVAAVLMFVLLCGCAPMPPGAPASSPSSAPDRGGMVRISTSREMFLTCRGSGSPTVVLISGTGGAADEWTTLPRPQTPLPTATPAAGPTAVLPSLSADVRVCAYDRPGTIREDGATSPSTPVTQPTTAEDGVRDLRDLLRTAGEEGPLVLVGASWGGLIAQLFTREDPQRVVGLILVDSASTWLAQTFSPAQWRAWMAVIAAARTDGTAESPAYDSTMPEFAAAAPVPDVPTTVLSSDQPWDLGVTPGASTWPGWLAAQDDLALSWHATHISTTHSGHGIQVERPALVVSAIRDVLESERGQ